MSETTHDKTAPADRSPFQSKPNDGFVAYINNTMATVIGGLTTALFPGFGINPALGQVSMPVASRYQRHRTNAAESESPVIFLMIAAAQKTDRSIAVAAFNPGYASKNASPSFIGSDVVNTVIAKVLPAFVMPSSEE